MDGKIRVFGTPEKSDENSQNLPRERRAEATAMVRGRPAEERNRFQRGGMVGPAGLEPATLSLEDYACFENKEHMRQRR